MGCRWEARVDGKSCPAPLAGSVYTHNSDNDHYPATIVGECPGVSAGNHQVQVTLPVTAARTATPGGRPALGSCTLSLRSRRAALSTAVLPKAAMFTAQS